MKYLLAKWGPRQVRCLWGPVLILAPTGCVTCLVGARDLLGAVGLNFLLLSAFQFVSSSVVFL